MLEHVKQHWIFNQNLYVSGFCRPWPFTRDGIWSSLVYYYSCW